MPTLQQQAAKMTRSAMEALFRTARHVPEDKQNWSPQGAARSVHSQLVECALMPHFITAVLAGQTPDLRDPAARQQYEAAAAAITTLDQAEATARENYAALCAAIEAVPDADLDKTHTLPFRGGMTMTTADVLFLPYYNMTYHQGQINYVQLMLGDAEMH